MNPTRYSIQYSHESKSGTSLNQDSHDLKGEKEAEEPKQRWNLGKGSDIRRIRRG